MMLTEYAYHSAIAQKKMLPETDSFYSVIVPPEGMSIQPYKQNDADESAATLALSLLIAVLTKVLPDSDCVSSAVVSSMNQEEQLIKPEDSDGMLIMSELSQLRPVVEAHRHSANNRVDTMVRKSAVDMNKESHNETVRHFIVSHAPKKGDMKMASAYQNKFYRAISGAEKIRGGWLVSSLPSLQKGIYGSADNTHQYKLNTVSRASVMVNNVEQIDSFQTTTQGEIIRSDENEPTSSGILPSQHESEDFSFSVIPVIHNLTVRSPVIGELPLYSPKESKQEVRQLEESLNATNWNGKNIALEQRDGMLELRYPIGKAHQARIFVSANLISPSSDNLRLNNMLVAEPALILMHNLWTREDQTYRQTGYRSSRNSRTLLAHEKWAGENEQ